MRTICVIIIVVATGFATVANGAEPVATVKCDRSSVPWVSDAERESVEPFKFRKIVGVPGTPEGDLERFYTNDTGFVQINYDEDKAGVLGRILLGQTPWQQECKNETDVRSNLSCSGGCVFCARR